MTSNIIGKQLHAYVTIFSNMSPEVEWSFFQKEILYHSFETR